MTTPLLDRTSAPEVVIIEQPDEPLLCTSVRPLASYHSQQHEPCSRTAVYEALCMGCGHVFRRCEPHYMRMLDVEAEGWQMRCETCFTRIYPEQFTRIAR